MPRGQGTGSINKLGSDAMVAFSDRGLFTYYVSQNQGFLDPPSPLRQLSSAFARRPFCTTIFDVDFFAGDIHL